MNADLANKIFDLLESIGGAHESMRSDFVHNHTEATCDEYRFQGHLGFGGKYRRWKNGVDCYREDETPERLDIIKRLNEALQKLQPRCDFVGCRHGEFDWPSSKGLCPKCHGTGKLPL